VRQLRRIPPQGFRRVCLFGGLATLRRKYNPGRFLDVDQGNLWVRPFSRFPRRGLSNSRHSFSYFITRGWPSYREAKGAALRPGRSALSQPPLNTQYPTSRPFRTASITICFPW
jgi:hypothetical protein